MYAIYIFCNNQLRLFKKNSKHFAKVISAFKVTSKAYIRRRYAGGRAQFLEEPLECSGINLDLHSTPTSQLLEREKDSVKHQIFSNNSIRE